MKQTELEKKQYHKEYRLKNKEHQRQWVLNNIEKVKEVQKKWVLNNKEKIKGYRKKYEEKIKEKKIAIKVYNELKEIAEVDYDNMIYLTDGIYIDSEGNFIDESTYKIS